jgi:protease II
VHFVGHLYIFGSDSRTEDGTYYNILVQLNFQTSNNSSLKYQPVIGMYANRKYEIEVLVALSVQLVLL